MRKKASSIKGIAIKSILTFVLGICLGNYIINNLISNREVRDAFTELLVGGIISLIYFMSIAPVLKNNLLCRITKSFSVFFLGCALISAVNKLNILGPILSGLLGWLVIIGTIYVIYRIFKNSNGIMSEGIKGKDSEGIIFGKLGQKTIAKSESEDGHVAVIGGAGSGKSSSVSIPTLLSWKGSAVIIDIKKELHEFTAGYREKEFNSRVYVFDPDDDNCDCYDPLEQVKGIDGATELARNMIPAPIKGDKFWANNAQAILAASVLDGIDRRETFSEICERVLITQPEQLITELLESDNAQVRLLASACNGVPDKTLGGIFAELRVHLLTFASDEKIKKATRKTTWTPEVLEAGASIYIRISEKMLEQYKSLISCMISQMFRYLTSRGDGKQPAILMLLDELPRLGRVEGLIEALGTLRSRNVHIIPMVQSLSDLDRHYGQDERKIILDNCNYKVVLGVGDFETQKYFSDLSGTEKVWQKSYNYGALLGIKKGTTDSLVEEKIIKPERFGQLKQDAKNIVFGFREPIELDKLFWFKTLKYKKIIETYKI